MDSFQPHLRCLPQTLLFLVLLVASNLLTFYYFSSSPPTPSPSQLPSPAAPLLSERVAAAHLPQELTAFTSPQPLPFGRNPNLDSDVLRPPVGHPCLLFPDQLSASLTYLNRCLPDVRADVRSELPPLGGCEPLPRRRCRPQPPPTARPPFPTLWSSSSPDRSVSDRLLLVTASTNPLDFAIDEVLAAASPPGSIRIGLDIGGGSGTFAVRMRERNVTVVATTMNLNGPFSNFIAARGIVPLYISISQRLPFFDNTLDIVHSMHVLSNWIPTTLLHFIVFDIYRVLRPGGVFWLDHFFFVEGQMEEYVGVIESVGFKKLKWEVGRKLDRGPELKEMYISALLEKPLKNSW
ncbi:uncharacterized protein LOC109711796 [Ananas comosus]|uniref:Uncharacterized protein LOC109711796 n=1 Tax=Ananas comosus TaxID=4615 RepID=A0A6P5F3D9_ANACO|nr:uncharacterized protein LOC109711796 [Ananas comosus]